jgi:hypothetical protein
VHLFFFFFKSLSPSAVGFIIKFLTFSAKIIIYLNTEVFLLYHKNTGYNIYKEWMTIEHLAKPESTAPLGTEMLHGTPTRFSRQTVYVKNLDEVAGPQPRKYGVRSDTVAAEE